MQKLEITFLGGAREVGKSALLIKAKIPPGSSWIMAHTPARSQRSLCMLNPKKLHRSC